LNTPDEWATVYPSASLYSHAEGAAQILTRRRPPALHRFTLCEIEDLRTTDANGVTVGEVWRKPGHSVMRECDFGCGWTRDMRNAHLFAPEGEAE
jgi:hypothetical protein